LQQSHPPIFVFDTETAIQDLGYGCAVAIAYGLPDRMCLAAGRCHVIIIGAILLENSQDVRIAVDKDNNRITHIAARKGDSALLLFKVRVI
jgi:hypothetical protein